MTARRLAVAFGLLSAALAAYIVYDLLHYVRAFSQEPPGVQDINAAAPIDAQVALGLWREHEHERR